MTVTALNTLMPKAVAGALVDTGPHEIDSFTSEETVNTILPGTFFAKGAADHGALILAATTDKIYGVAVQDPAAQPFVMVDSTTGGYKPGITFGGMRRGRLPFIAESAMVPGNAVHVRVTTNGTGKLIIGAVLPAKDTTKTIDASAFCQVIESGDATTPPVIAFDLTNAALAAADS